MASLVAADYGSSDSDGAISDEESQEKIDFASKVCNDKSSFFINNDGSSSDDEKSSDDDKNVNW